MIDGKQQKKVDFFKASDKDVAAGNFGLHHLLEVGLT